MKRLFLLLFFLQGCASIHSQYEGGTIYNIEKSEAELLFEDLIKLFVDDGTVEQYSEFADIHFVTVKRVKGTFSFIEHDNGVSLDMNTVGENIPIWETGGTGTLVGLYSVIDQILKEKSK